MKKLLFVFLCMVVLLGVTGAGISVAMLIRAVQWGEWGRVVAYCVTMAVSVEVSVLAIGKLRQKV